MTNFFRSGSFGYGTSVSGYSDVDYFAVIPRAQLKQDSGLTLNAVALALRQRFPNTSISVQSPAVVIPFGKSPSEKHEIIPADHVGTTTAGWNVYEIPNRVGGWMQSSPGGVGSYVDSINERLSKKVKPLIRLMKAWKYNSAVPIRSFYLEMRTAKYAASETSIVYKYDILRCLNLMVSSNLGSLPDPIGFPDPIYAAFSGDEINTSWSKLNSARQAADTAMVEERAGRVQNAFSYWNRVFNGNFPAYY
jgi:hypothetical protein